MSETVKCRLLIPGRNIARLRAVGVHNRFMIILLFENAMVLLKPLKSCLGISETGCRRLIRVRDMS